MLKMLNSCLYQAFSCQGVESKPRQRSLKHQRLPKVPAIAAPAPAKQLFKDEFEDELEPIDSVAIAAGHSAKIYAAGFGAEAPLWTAARLTPDSPTQCIVYAGLFEAVGGGPDCARAVAALSADYAAAAHLNYSINNSRRRVSCSLPEGASRVFPPWQSRTFNAVSAGYAHSSSELEAQQLAVHLGGEGLLADRMPVDLLSCHSDAIDRLLLSSGGSSARAFTPRGVDDRFARALHQLDADLCGLTVRSPSDPCCVPPHADWACRLAQTGAVGNAVSMETSLIDGRRQLRIAQIGDGAVVIGSIGASGAGWNWRQPVAPHTIENWREVRRLVRQFPDPADRLGLFARNCFLGEQEATRAFGRVELKWPADRLADLAWRSPTPILPACLTGQPEVASVPLQSADRLILLGSPTLWRLVEPDEAVACVGNSLTAASSGDSNSVGNPAAELLQLARGRTDRRRSADNTKSCPGVVVIELDSPSTEWTNPACEKLFQNSDLEEGLDWEEDSSSCYENENFSE